MKFLPSVSTLLLFAASAFGQIPSNAISSGPLDGSSSWVWEHDAGTPGTSTGSSKYAVSSPSLDGKAREFYVSYYDHGGERFHMGVAYDTVATHFVYDTYIYIVDPSQIANMELDLNQVLGNGQTVFLATQCSSYSKTWDYTYVSNNSVHWHSSNLYCNPKTWTAKTWHHVQIAMHRDSHGVVTHDWIGLDGKVQYFSNAVGFAGKYLGWAKGHITLNVQPDGASPYNGTMHLYLDKLQVYRW